MTDDVIKKLDPDLRQIRRQLVQSAAQTEDAKAAAAHTSEPEQEVRMPRDLHVLVRFRGRIEDLVAAGLRNPAVFEHRDHDLKVAGGDIVPERLGDLAAVDHVISISMPPPLEPLLNYSVPEARARSLQSGPQALTGKGVVIGIIDTGIEWRHGSFLTEEGNTRIRAICDLILRPLPADGSHPAEQGFDLGGAPLGVIYDRDWIDRGLRGERRIRTKDVETLSGKAGHGTHVAGIAAGDGSPRDCRAWSRFTYAGVAYGAEIVAVRVDGSVNHLDLAFSFIRDYVHDKPLVINISMGANSGPHDGTTDFELMIDNFVAPPAGSPTRVVVVAAGNAGADKCHVHVTIPTTGARTVDVPLKVNADDNKPRSVELWYVNGQQMNLQVIAPDGTSSPPVLHGNDHDFVLNPLAPPAEQVVIRIDGTANAPNNNDPFFKVTLPRRRVPGRATLPDDVWTLRLTNAGATPVDVHAWVSAGGTDLNAPIFPTGSSSDMTISFPASARGAIAVANYESRRSQCDFCASGEVVDKSSRGPVRNESAANPNPKPTIAAPGEDITSAEYDACTLKGNCCDCLPCCEVFCSQYQDMSGTSQAAPHVTGAVALMLELDRTMTKDDIVRYLSDTARRGPVGQEGVWGAGKLDVGAAIQLMRDLRPGLDNPPALVAAVRSSVDALRRAPARDAADAASSTAPAELSIPTTTPSAIELLRARVREIPSGELCAALVSRHFSEVRRLVNTNRRIATFWHRGEGPALLRRLLQGAVDPTAPSSAASTAQRAYLERMFTQLRRHGSPRLQATLDQYGSVLLRLLETPFAAQVASAAPEVHA
jgi:subtilisin family serine protease